MFAYGIIQLSSNVVSAIALAAIAFSLCSVKQESKMFNECVEDNQESGKNYSDAVSFCNGGRQLSIKEQALGQRHFYVINVFLASNYIECSISLYIHFRKFPIIQNHYFSIRLFFLNQSTFTPKPLGTCSLVSIKSNHLISSSKVILLNLLT